MVRFFSLLIATLVSLPVAMAHEGPRVWIGVVDEQVTTFRSDNDFSPTVFSPCRLFTAAFDAFGSIYTTEFPGYEVVHNGGNVASGTTFRFDIAGPALYFDEVDLVFVTTTEAFGPPSPGPVPQIAFSLGATVRRTAAGPVSGFNFFTHNAAGDHSHLSYTLFGNGTTASDGPDGVYAVSMTLSADGLATSQPYYLLLGKNVSTAEPLYQTALDIARATLIGVDLPGDMTCDTRVDIDDLEGFVEAILASDTFSPAIDGCCSVVSADMNDDGLADGRDIQLIVAAMLGE